MGSMQYAYNFDLRRAAPHTAQRSPQKIVSVTGVQDACRLLTSRYPVFAAQMCLSGNGYCPLSALTVPHWRALITDPAQAT